MNRKKTVVRLRQPSVDDALDLFAWRNDPEARRYFVHSEPVSWAEHVRWLEDTLASNKANRILCIAENDEGRRLGVVRADRIGDTFELSYTVAPDARGEGWGKRMAAAFVAEHCRGYPILAKIMKGHVPSEKIAMYLGLHPQAEEVHDDRTFIVWRR